MNAECGVGNAECGVRTASSAVRGATTMQPRRALFLPQPAGLPFPQPGGLPDSSRGSERSVDPRKSAGINCTPEGCQKPLLVRKRRARSGIKAEGRLFDSFQKHRGLDQLECFWLPGVYASLRPPATIWHPSEVQISIPHSAFACPRLLSGYPL